MNKHIYSIRKMTKLLKISRATKHRYDNYELPESKAFKCKVINKMVQIWSDSGERYGAPKIRAILEKEHNIVITIRTASVYMREINIQSRRSKKYKPGKSQKDKIKRKNLLHKQIISTVNTHILTDITYVYTIDTGWVYFLSFMDLVTRKILKWDVSKQMDSEFVNSLLCKLINDYPSIEMIHSDQGSQYTANNYVAILVANGIQVSYSRKGYPYHNAWIESFHSTLKREQLYDMFLMTLEDVKFACFEFIDGFYNTLRIHESIGYKTPNEFEEELLENKILKLNNTVSNGFITYTGEIKEFAI